VIPKPPDAVAPIAVFIAVCMSAWTVFLVRRVRRDPSLLERWGLRPTSNLGPVTTRLAPVLAIAIASGALFAHGRGRPLALTGASRPWLVALGGVGFGIVHIQHPALAAATGVLGALYVALFQRWRNVWPLGVCHGWLGSLFYPWVLDINPLSDMMGLLR
jgi:hypothetical protein